MAKYNEFETFHEAGYGVATIVAMLRSNYLALKFLQDAYFASELHSQFS